uniref:Putative DNA ligase n=1 Tax=Trypanosoma congolense (strain IL3000) TaxID=1068625 RepID=G0UPC0_TRYCI|nr:putative DNA ligase [Trypanosoma congolense IL3000]
MYLSRTCFASQFSTTRLLLIRSARLPSAKNLAEFHPSIARSWITAASNKLLQPQHVMPNSRKLAWWRCLYCEHQYSKRVDLHVAAGGICPKCNRIPRLASDQEKHAGDSEMLRNKLVIAMKHRCRPDNSLSVLEAPNANRVKSSIADDDYLRVSETRNLLPMLARSYDKEVDKISDRDELYVSPKLDGVRCVVAWNVRSNGLSFFSRSGTLFECCDHIERQLKPLFKRDNTLVLDGELYIHKAADFEQLMSTVRTMRCNRTPEIEKLQKKLQYHVLISCMQRNYLTCLPYPLRSVTNTFFT